jgi:hypothetical protein
VISKLRNQEDNDGAGPLSPEACSAFAKVKGFLDAWDPYCLVSGGAPGDQFEPEASAVAQALASRKVQSEHELAAYIADLFAEWYDSSFTPQNCLPVAHRIWSWWQKRERVRDQR